MIHHINIQHDEIPIIAFSHKQIQQWAMMALTSQNTAVELTIQLVDLHEMHQFNHRYRGIDKPTNVLAFPSQIPHHIPMQNRYLGDVIISPEVLFQESQAQHIPNMAHWAHIVIHGVLHLQGYNHIFDQDTKIMQALEIKMLNSLGFSNPYHHNKDNTIE